MNEKKWITKNKTYKRRQCLPTLTRTTLERFENSLAATQISEALGDGEKEIAQSDTQRGKNGKMKDEFASVIIQQNNHAIHSNLLQTHLICSLFVFAFVSYCSLFCESSPS